MINIKIEKRDNGTVSSVLSQGHSNAQICAAVSTLMQACGHQLELMKCGVMEITEKDMCLVSSIKQSKQAIAVVDVLLNGVESLARQYPFCITLQYLFQK